MRMGVLDLFVLVVGICLAVLAVLALSTSLASVRLSERQVDSMQQIYDIDAQGQRFAAELDAKLLALAGGGGVPADVFAALSAELPGLVADAAEAAEEVLVEAKALGVDEMREMLGGTYGAMDTSHYVGGVRAVFQSADGHELTCLFGIDGLGGYDVLVWRSTKVWDESAQSEQLWLG